MVSRIDPLRVLTWLECVVVALAFAAEVVAYAFHLAPPQILALGTSIPYFITAAIATIAVFSIPHAPNRRYWLIALAMIGIAVARAFPQHDVVPLALELVFGARVIFAFGLRGVALPFAAEILCAPVYAISETSVGLLTVPQALFEVSTDIVLMGFIFSLIGITWMYAEKASRAAAVAERMRIALDLHDSLGHRLTTLNVQLQNVERLRAVDAPKADAYIERASTTAAEALADVREAVALLHDDAVASRPPLPILLERMHDDFVETHGIELAWQAHFANDPPGRIGMEIHRVLQEALTNVARHAGAKNVEVRIHGGDEAIDVLVSDDGIGFLDAGAGHGLRSMRARIESLGGTFTIASTVGRGTRIQAHVPMEARA